MTNADVPKREPLLRKTQVVLTNYNLIEITGPDGSTIELGWDDHLGGFRVRASLEAGGFLATNAQLVPISTNTIVVKAVNTP